MTDTTTHQKRRLRAHFGFAKMPFAKAMWAAHMFDSASQRDLLHGLHMWLEILGFALVTGASGVGKSITLRRFVQDLDETRYRVVDFAYLPTTVTGFLRSLNRKLGLPMRLHSVDLFDQAQKHLVTYQQERGAHPIVLIDDAEGLSSPVMDLLRRLTAFDMDAEDHFSVLLSGTDDLLGVLRHPSLASLRSRVFFAEALKPFGMDDARNYIRFHLERAQVDPRVFTDQAIRHLFQASQGRPRNINQLATQALIQAAVQSRDAIDGDFMGHIIDLHPLYQRPTGGSR